MNRSEYFEFHKNFCDNMMEITKKKNLDYCGKGSDPFANFSRVEAIGIASTEQGFLTRIMDKICRINSFVQNGTLQIKEESVLDNLTDLANYAALFAGYLQSKKTQVSM